MFDEHITNLLILIGLLVGFSLGRLSEIIMDRAKKREDKRNT
jgi:NhaP-type Na+/H+ or K+/H+ antiporter